MSDFLSSLIERASGRAEIIRPRLPSLFEPVRSVPTPGPPFPEPDPGDIRFEQTVVPEPERPAPSAPPFHPTSPPLLANVPEEQPSKEEPPAPRLKASQRRTGQPAPAISDSSAEERASTPPIVPGIARSVRAARLDSSPVLPESPPPREDAPVEHAASSVMKPAETAVEPVRPDRSRVEASQALRPDWAPAETSQKTREKDASPVGEQPRLAPLAQPLASLPRARRRSRFEPAERLDAAPPSEPIVHVTIGRIEVRAIPQERAAKPERRPSAVMGLDEYLRSRAKAGAR